MRLTSIRLGAALVSALIIGCGSHGSKLVGDWDTSVPDMGPATISFVADGSMTMTAAVPPAGKDAKMTIYGKWTEDGDKVHMTYNDVKFSGLDPAMQAQQKKMEEGAKKGVGMGTENVIEVKFSGDDSFSSTDNKGVTSNFKRKGK